MADITVSSLKLRTPVPLSGRPTSSEVADTQDEFAKISKAIPRDKKAEDAFFASKVHLLLTHPTLEPPERELALTDLRERLGEAYDYARTRADTAPTPGGTGYGAYYYDAFKRAFATGTSLYFDVVCPAKPGGNVTDYLYLTAMNRAAKGVEAFISYQAQTDFHFKVFDWSRAIPPFDPWVRDIPFANLGNYLNTTVAHGVSYPTMGVLNSTVEIAVNKWRNETWLWNRVAQRWDLIYSNDYASDHAGQVDGFNGSWGPIVETFQTLYMNTNRLGFLNIGLNARGGDGTWGSWTFLGPSPSSYIRTDNVGFRPLFLDPNYSYVVYS